MLASNEIPMASQRAFRAPGGSAARSSASKTTTSRGEKRRIEGIE